MAARSRSEYGRRSRLGNDGGRYTALNQAHRTAGTLYRGLEGACVVLAAICSRVSWGRARGVFVYTAWPRSHGPRCCSDRAATRMNFNGLLYVLRAPTFVDSNHMPSKSIAAAISAFRSHARSASTHCSREKPKPSSLRVVVVVGVMAVVGWWWGGGAEVEWWDGGVSAR